MTYRTPQRCFLFLQGPIGPFFRKLGDTLVARGHRVVRVNFNGGDWFDWAFGGAVPFRGTAAEWPAFLLDLTAREGVTDLVLFGDCRALHAAAIATLRQHHPGVALHVLEEGYIRPHWVTIERGGTNGFSALPRTAQGFREAPEADLPPPPYELVRGAPFTLFVRTFLHYLFIALLRFRFRRYCHHRRADAIGQGYLWLKRLVRMPALRRRALRRQTRLIASGRPYALVLLQLESDKQILVHSPYGSLANFVEEVAMSFKANAPEDMMLVFKTHPLDTGGMRFEQQVKALKRRLGIGGRVLFVDGGHLPTLINHCRSAITVNSTAGVNVLQRLKPLKAMGRVIYGLPGLCFQGSLDAFWTYRRPADAELFDAFYNVVMHRTQVNGQFYSRAGMRLAIESLLPRLEAVRPQLVETSARPAPETEAYWVGGAFSHFSRPLAGREAAISQRHFMP